MSSYLPFLTGSQAYGSPTVNSDVDVVVLLTDKEPYYEQLEISTTYEDAVTVRFGKLNIIFVYSQLEYEAWYAATQRMIQWKNKGWPVPKEQAILEIDKEHDLRDIRHRRINLSLPDSKFLQEDDIPF